MKIIKKFPLGSKFYLLWGVNYFSIVPFQIILLTPSITKSLNLLKRQNPHSSQKMYEIQIYLNYSKIFHSHFKRFIKILPNF